MERGNREKMIANKRGKKKTGPKKKEKEGTDKQMKGERGRTE